MIVVHVQCLQLTRAMERVCAGPLDKSAHRRRVPLGQAIHCEGIEEQPEPSGPAEDTAVSGMP